MACVRLLSRLGIYYNPLHSYQCHGGASANSISVQQVYMFFWCQSGLLVDCRDAYWWILSEWFPGRKVSPSNAAYRRCLPSRLWLVVLLWVSAPIYFRPTIFRVLISCRQCWPYKGLQRLVPYISHLKNGKAEVRRRSHRWELGADVMGEKIED